MENIEIKASVLFFYVLLSTAEYKLVYVFVSACNSM